MRAILGYSLAEGHTLNTRKVLGLISSPGTKREPGDSESIGILSFSFKLGSLGRAAHIFNASPCGQGQADLVACSLLVNLQGLGTKKRPGLRSLSWVWCSRPSHPITQGALRPEDLKVGLGYRETLKFLK